MISLRPIQTTDITVLTQIARQIFRDAFLPVNRPQAVEGYLENNLTEESFSLESENPLYFTYGVFCDQRMIGYIQLYLNREETYEGIELELKRFYLLAGFHGKEVAQQMMQFCFSIARELGHSKLWLGVWEKNLRAQKFYSKMGFHKITSHAFVMGDETQTDDIFAIDLTSLSQSQK